MARKKEEVLEELTQVKFVGPRLATVLYDELNVRSLDDLIQAAKDNKLVDLPGIGDTKQSSILRSATRQASKSAQSAPAEKSARQKKTPSSQKKSSKPGADAQKSTSEKSTSDKNGAQDDNRSAPKSASKSTPKRDTKSEPMASREKAASPRRPAERAAASGLSASASSASASAEGGHVETSSRPAGRSEKKRPADLTLRERFIATLRCPACGNDEFTTSSSTITCQACQRQFNVQNGVADLAPPYIPDRSVAQRLMEARLYTQFYEDIMRPRLTGVVSDRTLREEFRLSADYLELDEETCLLDVACGTANFTRYFAQRLGLAEVSGPDASQPLVVGMDISWPMLETARNNLRREGLEDEVFLLRGDATRIPVKRGAYNRIHCAGALHMMSDIDEALRNFARILEPDGICVIGTFILGEGLLRRFLKRVSEVPTKFHWFSREELHRRLERTGFEILEESVAGDAITLKARRV